MMVDRKLVMIFFARVIYLSKIEFSSYGVLYLM